MLTVGIITMEKKAALVDWPQLCKGFEEPPYRYVFGIRLGGDGLFWIGCPPLGQQEEPQVNVVYSCAKPGRQPFKGGLAGERVTVAEAEILVDQRPRTRRRFPAMTKLRYLVQGIDRREWPFRLAIEKCPEDQTNRLVFADWLQERDDPRADGYRAMAGLYRLPRLYREDESRRPGGGAEQGWTWFNGEYYTTRVDISDDMSVCPQDVFECLKGGQVLKLGRASTDAADRKRWRDYPTREAAEDAFALAWHEARLKEVLLAAAAAEEKGV